MKKYKIILSLIPLILLTGCWDLVEINQRIYPYSFGVDLNNNEDEGNDLKLAITYPNIKALGKNPTQDQKTYVLNTSGNSIFEAANNLSNEIQGPFYYKHLRVLVLGDEVARNKRIVKETIDGFMRDYIINKRVNMAMVQGSACELLNSLPLDLKQESVEGTIFRLLLNIQDSTFFTPQYMSDFINAMDKKGSAIVPILTDKEGIIIAEGAGVFKDYTLIGYITGEENTAIEVLNGNIKNKVIDTKYKGNTITLNVKQGNSKKELVTVSENLKMKYDIEVEAAIQQYTLSANRPLLGSQESIKEIEDAFEDKYKRELEKVISKLQKDLKADTLGIGEYLSKFHPRLWKDLEDNWDEVFSEIEIEVNLEVMIRRKGLIL